MDGRGDIVGNNHAICRCYDRGERGQKPHGPNGAGVGALRRDCAGDAIARSCRRELDQQKRKGQRDPPKEQAQPESEDWKAWNHVFESS